MTKKDFEVLMNSLYSNNQLFIPQGQTIEESIDNAFVDKREEAINYSQCCETVKDKYTHTFEVDLNSEKRKEQYNKQIEQIHNAPCKAYFYDGENYIELKP